MHVVEIKYNEKGWRSRIEEMNFYILVPLILVPCVAIRVAIEGRAVVVGEAAHSWSRLAARSRDPKW